MVYPGMGLEGLSLASIRSVRLAFSRCHCIFSIHAKHNIACEICTLHQHDHATISQPGNGHRQGMQQPSECHQMATATFQFKSTRLNECIAARSTKMIKVPVDEVASFMRNMQPRHVSLPLKYDWHFSSTPVDAVKTVVDMAGQQPSMHEHVAANLQHNRVAGHEAGGEDAPWRQRSLAS